ncbi:PAS domain S-box protein, partial [Chloroflexota bacterium]
ALRVSEENFRNSLDNSPLGIRILTSNGETLYANRSFLNLYGYSTVDEFKNTLLKERYTPGSYTEYLNRKTKRQQGIFTPEGYEISIISRDGDVRRLRVHRRQVIWAGKTEYQSIYEDITERKRAIDTLKVLSRRLIQIQEEERTNIARELHDQIGQSLNIVKILLDRISKVNSKDRQDLLGQARQQLADLIDQVSMLSLDLRPKILDDLGLAAALEWYFKRFTTHTNIRVQFEQSYIERSLDAQLNNAVYRVVQEALTNVARHANATMVTVKLSIDHGTLKLRIEDDGIGFEPAALPAYATGGIIGMQERINLVGGILQIQSKLNNGTRITVRIPDQNEAGKEERQG